MFKKNNTLYMTHNSTSISRRNPNSSVMENVKVIALHLALSENYNSKKSHIASPMVRTRCWMSMIKSPRLQFAILERTIMEVKDIVSWQHSAKLLRNCLSRTWVQLVVPTKICFLFTIHSRPRKEERHSEKYPKSTHKMLFKLETNPNN